MQGRPDLQQLHNEHFGRRHSTPQSHRLSAIAELLGVITVYYQSHLSLLISGLVVVVVLANVADQASLAGFWVLYNIVILTYLLTCLLT